MSGYFYTLMLASVCGAVCTMLTAKGYEKYVKYIASLVCIVLMVAPLKEIDIDAVADTDRLLSESTPQGDGVFGSLAGAIAEERAEEYISQLVLTEFGIKTVYTDIKIDWDKTEPTIESISVALEGKDMAFADSARDYLFKILGGEVDVIEG